MDNPTANKSHIPCPSWTGQNGWSPATSQGPLISTFSTPYDQMQASSQSCMSNLSTFSTTNSPHALMYKAPHTGSISSSNILFSDTDIPTVSQVISFGQQNPHPSSIMGRVNQGKNLTHFHQPNQGLQPCRPQHLASILPNDPYKASFQTSLASQVLSNRIQDLPPSLLSCGQHQAAFEGEDNATPVAGTTQSYTSSNSQAQPQWMPSSHCRGAVNDTVPDAAVYANKELLQGANSSTVTRNEKRRSDVLQQRAELLKQLAEMDKLLEALPPDDISDGQSSVDEPSESEQTTGKSKPHPSADCSSTSYYKEQNNTCDTPQDPMSPAESVKKEDASDISGEDDDPDYLPVSDGEGSRFQSETKECSPDESTCSNPASPASKGPSLSEEHKEKSEHPSCKNKSATPVKKTCAISQRKASQTLVLPASKLNDHRIYKKNYCLFCSKPMSKMSRHLVTVHSDRPEVAAAFQYPKHSKERQKIWSKLTNQGNFAHNKDVLRTGEGNLVVRQTPSVTRQARDFLHCLYCHALYRKKLVYRHMRRCPENSKNENHLGRKRIASKCALAAVDCEDRGITDVVKSILGEMIYDDVTQTIMDDNIILQFAEYLHNKYSGNVNKHPYISQNLRQIARLVLEAQKTTTMQKLEDFFHPSNFQDVVSAVNVLAGYDSKTKKYAAPSLAVKLGHNLQKTCSIVEDNAVKSGDTKQAESARNFLSVYRKKWTKQISSCALSSLREIKSNNEKQVPSAQDVKLMYFHMEKVHHMTEKNLRDSPSLENYTALARVMLARVIFFNRRKPREVSSIKLTDFMSRKKPNTPDDMDVAVTNLEKTMCRLFTRVEVRGDCGTKVPVLLKPSFESALELLVNTREVCGVTSQNPFLFGRPSALTVYRGSDCIQGFIKECGAKNPEALTSKSIRKHFAKMLQLMNFDENEANQIFGPNNKIQLLRQCSDSTLDDIEIESGEDTWDGSEGGPAPDYHQQTHGGTTGSRKSIRGSQHKTKHTWEEAEVRAVERHLMRFIEGHKVPQKDDCIKCLEAEPKALRTRTWKGLKDYVRNRITTLKRQSGCSQDSSNSSKRPRPVEPQQTRQPAREQKAGLCDQNETSGVSSGLAPFYHQQAHEGTTTPKSTKSRGQDSHRKTKHSWDEAEVRAVERHMMRFIQGHRVPQKEDCVKCLEAEPRALRTRTWKGVKDYVRNRITTLKRQSDCSQDSANSSKRPRRVEPQQTGNPASGKQPGPWDQNEPSGVGSGPAPSKQARERAKCSSKTTTPKSSGQDSQHKTKHSWEEAEVRAVERHMMHFIQEHKVPQKDDCVKCLEAEPRALRTRTWKSIKDYVRNRITTLKRQSDCSQDSSNSSKRPRHTAHYQQL